MDTLFSDEYFMKEALKEAQKAFDKGEVPIGAIIVSENTIVARAHNLTEQLNDVTAHAEMQAFTAAADTLGGKYLHNCTLYVTIEPCVMCCGASYWTQISKIIYAATEPKRSPEAIHKNILHPKTTITGNVLSEDAAILMKKFFASKRA